MENLRNKVQTDPSPVSAQSWEQFQKAGLTGPLAASPPRGLQCSPPSVPACQPLPPDHGACPAHWRALQALLPTTTRPPGDLTSPRPCSKFLQAPTGRPIILKGTPSGFPALPPTSLSPASCPRAPHPSTQACLLLWTSVHLFFSLEDHPPKPASSSSSLGSPRNFPFLKEVSPTLRAPSPRPPLSH